MVESLVQCSTCQGRKQLTGLGCMTVDCPTCKAVGFIPFTNKTDIAFDDTKPDLTALKHAAIKQNPFQAKIKRKTNNNAAARD